MHLNLILKKKRRVLVIGFIVCVEADFFDINLSLKSESVHFYKEKEVVKILLPLFFLLSFLLSRNFLLLFSSFIVRLFFLLSAFCLLF